jgi:hypothetical protein
MMTGDAVRVFDGESMSRGETLPTAEQVAEFLRQNPGFFENHVDSS